MTIRRKGRSKLSKAAIEDIIEATGKPPDSEDQLARDLDVVDTLFAFYENMHSSKPADRKKQINRIATALKKWESVVNKQPDYIKETIGKSLNFKEALAALSRPESKVDFRIGDFVFEIKVPLLRRREPTPIETLTGLLLPLVFETRFGLPAKWSRQAGQPHGPVIDFIEATAGKLGVNCSRETIGRAFSRLKNEREQLRPYLRWANPEKINTNLPND